MTGTRLKFPETKEMADALRHSGRDIIYSLSNNMNITNAPAVADCELLAHERRHQGELGVHERQGFGEDKWAAYAGPGHWNDPDMLEIATKGKKSARSYAG